MAIAFFAEMLFPNGQCPLLGRGYVVPIEYALSAGTMKAIQTYILAALTTLTASAWLAPAQTVTPVAVGGSFEIEAPSCTWSCQHQ